MTTKTVAWVAPEANEWDGGEKGKTWFVNVRFDDGEAGSLGKKDSKTAEGLRLMLEGLIGQSTEFGLKDSGKKTNEGATKWYIESFPGYEPAPYKPAGAKREFVPRYQDTAEGFASLQASMDRRTALMQATAVCVGGFIGEGKVIALADSYYSWLRNVSPEVQQSPGEQPDAARTMGKGLAASGGTSTGGTQGDGTVLHTPVEDSPTAGPSGSPPSQDDPENRPGRGASKPVCSVNGPRHKPDPERSAKARPGFVVCACGDAAPTAEAAAQWAPVEQVTV